MNWEQVQRREESLEVKEGVNGEKRSEVEKKDGRGEMEKKGRKRGREK